MAKKQKIIPGYLYINWNKVEPKIGIDIIPISKISKSAKEITHHIKMGDKLSVIAKCKVTIKNNIVDMDYNEFSEYNNSKEVACVLGIMRLEYKDSSRRGVPTVSFQYGAKEEFESYENKIATIKPYRESKEEGYKYKKESYVTKRDINLVRQKKDSSSSLSCEACDFNFDSFYKNIGTDFCEVHHLKQLSGGVRKTTLSDLAILCSNCHSMIHKIYPPISIKTFKKKYIV